MRFLILFVFAIHAAVAAEAKSFREQFPNFQPFDDAEEMAFLESLNYRTGKIVLADGITTLRVPTGYYFLGPSDANRVLTEAWENPPEGEPLGMLFPADLTPHHSGAWGVEIYFEEIGYVTDEDAEGYDYDALLVEMKADTREESEWRVQNGYDTIELVGWAAPPHYDRKARKLHWAKELRFGGGDYTTLNYNIRALGRRGVLVMNFIADMSSLPEIQARVPEVLAMSSFNDGERHADFDPSIDEVAAYGIGGLIAGKVLTKAGILAGAVLFLKKFWFVALLPIAWLWRRLRGGRS